jgi:competence protein ComEA
VASLPAAGRDRRRIGVGVAIVAGVLALAVTVGIGILRGAGAPTQTLAGVGAPRAVTAAPTVTAAAVYVDVAGAVTKPGLFLLPRDARLVDAIAAAGGFAADAQRDAVNLARPLADGEQIVVPRQGEQPPASTPSRGSTGQNGGRIDLNTADSAALETLPRVGPALATRILQWRAKNGRFTSVDDLLAVPGIGDKMLEALRDLVTV